jgi:hypothetical protein
MKSLRLQFAYTTLSWFLRQEAHQQTAALVAVSNNSIKRRTPPAWLPFKLRSAAQAPRSA